MLDYTWRIRDLVHGTIVFTNDEQRLVNTPIFQRLRNVKQNDLSGEVYPSANTSRFEHTLGACHVAGRMAEQLTKGGEWKNYARTLGAEYRDFQFSPEKRFIQTARFYALLHDIGHFPLSHLFEDAFTQYAALHLKKKPKEIVNSWFGPSDFTKPHEAFGGYLTQRLIQRGIIPRDLAEALSDLMTKKTLEPDNPLQIIKKIMDAEVDADRIDFVRRDGLLAGGDYGNYDITRLCEAVMLVEFENGMWDIAFSDKSITHLEAILLDRYRVYLWVHFHHHGVAVKTITARLIAHALTTEAIKKEDFVTEDLEALALRDDPWLWSVLRAIPPDNPTMHMMQRAVFYHERSTIANIWERRARYRALREQVIKGVRKARGLKQPRPKGGIFLNFGFVPEYEAYLTEKMGMQVFCAPLMFKPLEKEVRLFAESTKELRGEKLTDVSALISNLTRLWRSGDPQEFVILLCSGIESVFTHESNRIRYRNEWVKHTIDYSKLTLVTEDNVVIG